MRKVINDDAKKIDFDMIKKINLELEEARPQSLIDALECFVALLRNKLSANHIDVKLYMLDHGKLQFKMRTIDAKKLSYDVVKKAIERLAVLTKSQAVDEQYLPITHWCSQFTSYSEYHLDEVNLETKKRDILEQMSNMNASLTTKNDLLKIVDAKTLVQFYEDQEPHQRMLDMIEDCRDKARGDAQDQQMRY